MTSWDPAQYAQFSGHRFRPALELFARVADLSPRRVYDIGCGRGEIARLMAERWPEAEVTGVDSSATMLAAAAAEARRVLWIEGDLADWSPPEPADLIYGNAVLHWLPGHDSLFPRLMDGLVPGGVLAIQMPLSWDEPSHVGLRRTLETAGPGGTPLGPGSLRRQLGRRWVENAAWYYDLLAPLSAALDIWETRYLQVLQGEDAVLEWVKGTALRPVLDTLSAEDTETFLAAYRRQLDTDYPRRAGGETLFPFPRLFIVARKPG